MTDNRSTIYGAMQPETGEQAHSFLYSMRKVTEAAARSAYHWIGRGKKEDGDGAAVIAMRDELNRMPIHAEVVIGEGEKDEAPGLFTGEVVGTGSDGLQFDLAVDPVEGTTYLAKGLTNAMAVMAMSPKGTMFNPGPAFYMEKFACPARAKGQVDLEAPVDVKLQQLAKALDKKVEQLNIYVLEKPRHKPLVQAIYEAGAKVSLYPAGDVAGSIMAAIPGSGIDALMGTGGTPEGIISACAIRALGGEFCGRIDPQLEGERRAVRDANMDTVTWYRETELVQSDKVFFCATGITTGLLFEGVEDRDGFECTETLMIDGISHERQYLRTFYKAAKE